MRNCLRLGFFLNLVLVFSAFAAAETQKVTTDQTTVEILSEKEAAAPGATQWIGIYFKPKAGWHVYWTNPGDSGLPPRAEFSSAPAGSKFGSLEFPTPHRVPYGPLVNFAYEGDALYPVKWTAPESVSPGESITVTASLKWLICKEECVPGRAQLSLKLPIASAERLKSIGGTHAELFKTTVNALPVTEEGKVRLALVSDPDGKDHLEIDYSGKVSKGDLHSVFFFPEGEYGIGADVKPKVEATADGVRVLVPRKEKKDVGEIRGVLKLGEGRGVIVSEVLNPALLAKKNQESANSGTGGHAESLGLMLLFALIGGIILNLMPCILPVLSIKIMALANQGGAKSREIRMHGVVYTLGILVSFWVMAGILLAVRSAGVTLGWGFQLQSPFFVAILSLLFFVMGLNLFGFFEVGTKLMGVGGNLASMEGYAGSLFTGFLTTVAATPCSAPFMGTALGFALTQPAQIAILVLTTLGIGLALPYLVFSFSPGAASILPRPGAWMKTMKEFLAFPLFATVAWLLSVLGDQAGGDAVFHVLVSLILVTAAIWLFSLRSEKPASKFLSRFFAIVALVIAFALVKGVTTLRNPSAGERTAKSPMVHEPWKEWSEASLEKSLSEKKTVLVNLTASWCVTCKVNETVVFERDSIKKALASDHVVALLGDWTNGDPAITSYMTKFGRNSVPVYLLYSHGAREPKILPQILGVDSVLKELQ